MKDDDLKYAAQPYCRASLFESGSASKWSAFTNHDVLEDVGYIQVENTNVVPVAGSVNENKRIMFSLTDKGCALAASCVFFFECLDEYHKTCGVEGAAISNALYAPHMKTTRVNALRAQYHGAQRGGSQPWDSDEDELVLLVDSQEDSTYRDMLKRRADVAGIKYEERTLPVGDYMFVRRKRAYGVAGGAADKEHEYVQPVIVERKSWRDLAGSLPKNDKDKGGSRFQCAGKRTKLGGCGSRKGQKCQICRMISCRIYRRIVLVEGPRCACRDAHQCQTCRDLESKHLPTINHLEDALDRLVNEFDFQIVRSMHFR